jgi:hypothetical protein
MAVCPHCDMTILTVRRETIDGVVIVPCTLCFKVLGVR